METRNESKRREAARLGIILECYTQKSFVKVYPAFGIDKVKLSFADIGSSGKGGFDIYVDVDRFDLLCDDILSFMLKKSILSEQKTSSNPYPYSWKYVTGNSAEKEIRISQGMKSEVNIYARCGKTSKNIPMSYDDLRIMAKYFRRISEEHFNMLRDMTIQGMNNNAKYFKTNEEDKEKNEMYEEPLKDNTNPSPNSKNESKKENKGENTNQSVAENIRGFSTISEIKKIQEDMYYVDVIDKKSNSQTKLYFNNDSINSLGKEKWSELQEKVKIKKIALNIHVKENKGEYLFLSLAVA